MRYVYLSLTIAVFGFINLSMANNQMDTALTPYDFRIEKVSNTPPPIGLIGGDGSSNPSYNEWICFSTLNITLTCTEHIMESVVKTPMIAAYADEEAFEVETTPIENINCEETLIAWSELLGGQESFCVLAAYLQELPHGNKRRSLWILDALKTSNGYWLTPTFNERLSSTSN